MVNRFENINDYSSLVNTLDNLKVQQDCCRTSTLVSPSGQRFQLKPLIDFVKNNRYVSPHVITHLTTLNTALKKHTFSPSSNNCLQWIWQLLLRLGHALAKLFGGVSSPPDLQNEINTLIPNWTKEELPKLPLLGDPNTIKRDQVQIYKPHVVRKVEEEKFLQHYKLNVNTRELRATFFETHLNLYFKGELKEQEGFLLVFKELMKLYPQEALQICVEKMDLILNLDPKSPFIQWFIQIQNDGLFHTSFYRGLITDISRTQFIKFCGLAFTQNDQPMNNLLDQMISHILRQYPKDQEVLCCLLAGTPFETLYYERIRRLLEGMDATSLTSITRKFSKKEQLRLIIELLPYENLREKMDAILLAFGGSDKTPVTVESLIKEELSQDENNSSGMEYLARLSICNDLKMLQSDLSLSEKQAAISSRVEQLKNRYSQASVPSVYCLENIFKNYIKHIIIGCEPDTIPILLMSVANEPMIESESYFIAILKEVIINNNHDKINKAFVTLWPLLDGAQKANYRFIANVFHKVADTNALGIILDTFPPCGQPKWLEDLFISFITNFTDDTRSPKFNALDNAKLVQNRQHLYCLLDPPLLNKIFSSDGITNSILQAVLEAREAYLTNLSAELLKHHPLSTETNKIILSYMLNIPERQKIAPPATPEDVPTVKE